MKYGQLIAFLVSLSFLSPAMAGRTHYGKKLCNKSDDYVCVKVKRGQSWKSLFPDAEDRDIVRRVNRMNTRVWAGMTIAVPKNLSQVTIYDVAPFPRYIDSNGEKSIYVNQNELAWGAYDENGELLWWGPISSGKNYCADVGKGCKTPGGTYRVYRKQGAGCVSSAFPRRKSGIHGGAPMPYCMHFHRGFALHGAPVVPGYRDSHGCVRLFVEDAKWLNEQFIDAPKKGQKAGTKVIVGQVEI